MSERISVGDLVVVVRKFGCGCGKHLGEIFTVTKLYIAPAGGLWKCSYCGANGVIRAASPSAKGSKTGRGMPLRVLKRIPPLSELERESTEAKEPA